MRCVTRGISSHATQETGSRKSGRRTTCERDAIKLNPTQPRNWLNLTPTRRSVMYAKGQTHTASGTTARAGLRALAGAKAAKKELFRMPSNSLMAVNLRECRTNCQLSHGTQRASRLLLPHNYPQVQESTTSAWRPAAWQTTTCSSASHAVHVVVEFRIDRSDDLDLRLEEGGFDMLAYSTRRGRYRMQMDKMT